MTTVKNLEHVSLLSLMKDKFFFNRNVWLGFGLLKLNFPAFPLIVNFLNLTNLNPFLYLETRELLKILNWKMRTIF